MRGNELITSVGLQNYLIVSTERDRDKANDFQQTMERVGPPMGIKVNRDPRIIALKNDRTDSFLSCIEASVTRETQMVSSVCLFLVHVCIDK